MTPADRIASHRRQTLAMATVAWLAVCGAAHADDGPLTLARDGHFYVGGRTTVVDGRSYVSHQMYVEVRVPAKQTHRYPIVMVHGGTMSGTNFTGTPDGREGWAQYFVRRGFAVYVVDQPGRGRAGYWTNSYGAVAAPELEREMQRFAAPERYKLWPQAHLHTQWPGAAQPGDPIFDAFYATQFPSLKDFAKQQELNRDAGA